jgi:hypothetical protein
VDSASDAAPDRSCGSGVCGTSDICVIPCCGGAPPPCLPLEDGGVCSGNPCTLSGGGSGCEMSCTPPPPYCAPTPPGGCSNLSGDGFHYNCACA